MILASGPDALTVLADVGGLVVAVIAAGVAFFSYRHAVRQGSRANREVQIKSIAQDLVEPIAVRVAILESKVEVFWRNVAVDAAKVLHSPNPERRHLDAMLEAFMDDSLDDSGTEELKTALTEIRDYHPGAPSAFPIYPGEQVAAAILLQTMDLARGTSGQRRG